MKTIFDIASPEEIRDLYLGPGVTLNEKDQKEIIGNIKKKIESSEDYGKLASVIKLYIMRGDLRKAESLYAGIKDGDYAQSLGQEIIDAGGFSDSGKAQDGEQDSTTRFILGVAKQSKENKREMKVAQNEGR